ncbi:ABC transporter ATPase [Flammeovirga sp. MY04]|uniref:hypothetical protein n=1 Tax=Flammeovirga sp. MY04 TaxID=1191459 RepID=UPI00080636D8|nr:hypothetical protein [Flammeovirga sp. MY04]ANQ48806.1 ABC transporter ATPase [Flammeovirga sp. MY04]
MYTPISNLSDSSRLWIYQSNRTFTDNEKSQISEALKQFTSTWNAHGSDLQSSFEIVKDLFIVIAVDEESSAASGCSIDKCVGLIRQFEEAFGLSLFERTNVAYDTGDSIKIFPMNQAKSLIGDNVIQPTTPIYDNTVNNLGEFRKNWIKNADQSWLKRFFVSA